MLARLFHEEPIQFETLLPPLLRTIRRFSFRPRRAAAYLLLH